MLRNPSPYGPCRNHTGEAAPSGVPPSWQLAQDAMDPWTEMRQILQLDVVVDDVDVSGGFSGAQKPGHQESPVLHRFELCG